MERPENRWDEDRAWDLLEQRRAPAISPFFSRNVVRKARLLQQDRKNISFRRWLPALGAMGACLLILLTFELKPVDFLFRSHENVVQQGEAADTMGDFDTIDDLDQLIASEENNSWMDTSSHF